MADQLTVVICSYLEPQHVDRIRSVDSRIRVLYEPDNLRRPRYAADHIGAPMERTPEALERWRGLLGQADVLFDYDRTDPVGMPDSAPGVRWIQFTSAGVGQLIERNDFAKRMPQAVFTNAGGIHAQPLAEHIVLSILVFSRGLLPTLAAQRERRWERFAGTDVAGRTVLVFGLGRIGRAAARACRAVDMRVIGVKRSVEGVDPETLNLDELHAPDRLHELLPRVDALVLTAPHTPETEHIIGARELGLMPRGSIVVNVGRGKLIDEPALVAALQSGQLAGASLDVFEQEPLPVDSPLWDMPNVIVSPHSASTSDRENGRITDLFCENLRRWFAGEPLVNIVDTERLY